MRAVDGKQEINLEWPWSKWSKLVQRSTLGGCGLISFEVGQGSRPTFRCGQRSRPKKAVKNLDPAGADLDFL